MTIVAHAVIAPGNKYVHERTGHVYAVLHTGLMKLGDGVWHSCITYERAAHVFTRDEDAFRLNFTPL